MMNPVQSFFSRLGLSEAEFVDFITSEQSELAADPNLEIRQDCQRFIRVNLQRLANSGLEKEQCIALEWAILMLEMCARLKEQSRPQS
jgi:hypothetical protein